MLINGILQGMDCIPYRVAKKAADVDGMMHSASGEKVEWVSCIINLSYVTHYVIWCINHCSLHWRQSLEPPILMRYADVCNVWCKLLRMYNWNEVTHEHLTCFNFHHGCLIQRIISPSSSNTTRETGSQNAVRLEGGSKPPIHTVSGSIQVSRYTQVSISNGRKCCSTTEYSQTMNHDDLMS